MNIQNRGRQLAAGLLTLALCFSIMLTLMTASAAGGPDLGALCSLTVTTNEEYAEFREQKIPMRLYRVADVNGDGSYTPTEGFAGLELSGFRIDSAAQAVAELTDQAEAAVKAGDLTPQYRLQMENGTASIEDVPSGLYLLRSETAYAERYEYTAMPILVQLPEITTGVGEPEWIYDAEIVVKQLQTQRLGDLTISKTLEEYEPALGTATFVFQVEAALDGEIVYSNVETMFFDAAGTRTVTVDRLPVGAELTVQEVYSGAAYKPLGSESWTGSMTADGVSAAFTNTYNGSIVTGAGIQNHYAYQEGFGWTPEQIRGGGGGENE